MSYLKFPFNVLIKVKTHQIKLLKEKLQDINIKCSNLQKQLYEILQKKKDFENEIRQRRSVGDLKEGLYYDLHLQSLKEAEIQLTKEKEVVEQETLKLKEQLNAVLNEKKKFDKMKEKRLIKAAKHDRFFD